MRSAIATWHLNAGLNNFFSLFAHIPVFEKVFFPQHSFNHFATKLTIIWYFFVLFGGFFARLKFYAFFISSYLWFDNGVWSVKDGKAKKTHPSMCADMKMKFRVCVQSSCRHNSGAREWKRLLSHARINQGFFASLPVWIYGFDVSVTASNMFGDRPFSIAQRGTFFSNLLKNPTHVYHVHFKLSGQSNLNTSI